MPKIEWTVRVVQGHTDRDKLPGIWIEQFRRLGYVKLLAENDDRMVFEIYSPRGTETKAWADMNAERMRSFSLNAAAAPRWNGYDKVTL